MNIRNQKIILYTISATVIVTLLVQVYWNYNNYQQNKQRVLNEVQFTLDNALEVYYSDLSKKNYATSSPLTLKGKEKENSEKVFQNIFKNAQHQLKKEIVDTLKNNNSETQNMTNFLEKELEKKLKKLNNVDENSNFVKGFQTFFIAFNNDSIDYNKLISIVKTQLTQKNINIPFAIRHIKDDAVLFTNLKNKNLQDFLTINASSTFLKANEKLAILAENPTKEVLKRSITGILLSVLLSIAIISSLFYLLHIIKQQKQLSTIKNDLISNITHEFKTPITTIYTAIEALDSFNVIQDKEKTSFYLDISKNQLNKLLTMVEKLLDTATLDSNQLVLDKENTEIIALLETLVNKHQLNTKKKIVCEFDLPKIYLNIDQFHFENAISNLIDNAIKYGGDFIKIHLTLTNNSVKITVTDNGGGIPKNQQEKVFEQFYRISEGNTHNIKGFGIGLYYSKKIIEKHGGKIMLLSEKNKTIFKIIFLHKQ